MKKLLKCGFALAMGACMLLSACGGGGASSGGTTDNGGGTSGTEEGGGSGSTSSTYNMETRAFVMSIGAIDGNFNPFFYTAENDGSVASLTQVNLLATDANGNVTCGEDLPTVASAYTIQSYDANGNAVDEGDMDGYTTYSFLIKNGMKFSDGYDLTVMDVLFSMYVNLDAQYTGSATLYSNDIQGLKAYRAQDPDLDDSSTTNISNKFSAEGQQRLQDLVDYLLGEGTETEQVLADVATLKTLFREELESDWTSVEESFGSRDTDTFEYRFTEAWEYYLFSEGLVTVLTELNTTTNSYTSIKDEDGKYYTTLDDHEKNNNPPTYREDIEAAAENEELIAAYTSQGATREQAIEYVKRDTAIDLVYTAYATSNKTLANVAQYWASASTILEQFTNEARSEYYEQIKQDNGGKLAVETVSGINVERVNTFDGVELTETHDVLTITINGIDPKAIYNFAVNVCPMHYYSDETHYNAAMADYAKYIAAGKNQDSSGNTIITHFGVETGSYDFFNDVLQDTTKNKLPVGAGAYKASSSSGSNVSGSTFYSNNWVYYERNTYFYTMGDGINNAKIKYVRYREMGDDSILNSLIAEEIDYGMPSATSANQTEISKYSSYLSSAKYLTSGYGYVGINPKYVPDKEVRQAIMMSLNSSSIITDYYTSSLATVIHRPMSMTNWAYPTGATSYYGYTVDEQDIRDLVEGAGYSLGSDGIYAKGSQKLEYTFTIAGETTNHPAYNMFLDAAEFLNGCGFKITVQTDANALKKLNSGSLAVWAAAWSSAIDPDMYQVYHKDSTASSVKNWNYSEILNDSTGDWAYEYNIIQKLSDVIDQARETNNQSRRKELYKTALDYVMDLAVEFPTYQRNDLEVFNSKYIKRSSLTETPSTYVSLIDRIWEVEYN